DRGTGAAGGGVAGGEAAVVLEGVPAAGLDVCAGDGLETGAVFGLDDGADDEAGAGCGPGGVVGSTTFFSALRKGILAGSDGLRGLFSGLGSGVLGVGTLAISERRVVGTGLGSDSSRRFLGAGRGGSEGFRSSRSRRREASSVSIRLLRSTAVVQAASSF